MKLSDLKKMVQAIEEKTLPGYDDPVVTFYVPRDQVQKPAGEKEASQFVELSLCIGDVYLAGENITDQHRVQYSTKDVLHIAGDFTFPAYIVPFYK